jgi:hypothetical protein
VGGIDKTYSLGRNDGFTQYRIDFTPTVDQNVAVSFQGAGGDNIGMLLDNVCLAEVPEPASLVVWSVLGVAGVFACVRHRKIA